MVVSVAIKTTTTLQSNLDFVFFLRDTMIKLDAVRFRLSKKNFTPMNSSNLRRPSGEAGSEVILL